MGALARSLAVLAALGALALIAPIAATPAAGGPVRAGAAAVDASWHVGASAGQYADRRQLRRSPWRRPRRPTPTARTRRTGSSPASAPARWSWRAPTGTASRSSRTTSTSPRTCCTAAPPSCSSRATPGSRARTSRSPSRTTTPRRTTPPPSWGAWAFQDVYDVRFFDYYAKRMAKAVEQAADALVPVRIGASVSTFDKTHRHSYGPEVADDGTPAGYPNEETDHDLTVVRFDDVSDPAHPKPLANLVNFSLHPEMLSGNDLISADYVAPMQRMVDRETGGLTIYTQNAVGTAEPERSTYHSMHERLEFTHREYAQAEYARAADERRDRGHLARRGAPDARALRQVRGLPGQAGGRHGGQVVPGPHLASLPGRLELPHRQGGQGRSPAAGRRAPDVREREQRVAVPCRHLRDRRPARAADRAGRPRPLDRRLPGARDPAAGELLGALGYTGLEEDVSIHLQAFRLGDILFTVCSCEQWFDQSRNIKTRTDKVQGNEHHGYNWAARCTYNGDAAGTWTCPDPRNPSTNLPAIPTKNFLKMKAQVNNHANGWNDLSNLPWAESEPTDPDQDQGQLHALRAGARHRLPPDGADLDGERLQRLHRQLPRVPARRPLPQGPDRLGPPLQRLPGHAAGGDGRRAERRPDDGARARPAEGHGRRRAQRPARGQAGRDRRDQRDGVRGRTSGRRRHGRGRPGAPGHRALRRHVLQVGGRVELHRQPAREGAAPGGQRVARLRGPVG